MSAPRRLTIHWLSCQEALRQAYAEWQRLRRDAQELDSLDGRSLADIGLERFEIEDARRGRFQCR